MQTCGSTLKRPTETDKTNTDVGSNAVWGDLGARSERRHSQPTSVHAAIRQAER